MSTTTTTKSTTILIPSDSKKTGKTKGKEDYKETVEAGVYGSLVNVVNNLTFARLFVVSAVILYGVIAFSKKDKGVEVTDFSILFLFLIVCLVLFVAITLLRKIYYSNFAIFPVASFKIPTYGFRVFWPVVAILFLFFALFYCRTFIISFLNLFISFILGIKEYQNV